MHGRASLVTSGSFTSRQGCRCGPTPSSSLNGLSSSRKSTVTRTQQKRLQLGLSTTSLPMSVSTVRYILPERALTISLAGEDPLARTEEVAVKEPKSMNFFSKFGELQLLMLQHNAGLTASHPYASNPINWPFLLSGISFWTENDSQKQIYLIGNIIGWWTCVVALSIYVGIIGADLLARRRGIDPIPDRKHVLLSSLNRDLTIPINPYQLSAIGYGTTLAFSFSSGGFTMHPSSS